jgi:C-terminal processing protease CtpA/Prc
MPPRSPVDPAATRRQLAVLDELVGVVAENYVDPALNGKDWAAIGARYRQAVGAGLDDEAFYAALDLMIAELGDSHSYHESPTEVAEARAALEGQIDFVGIGVLLTPVVGTTHVAAIVVFPDGPAAAAGLRPHDSIVLVDGQDPVDSDGVGRIDLFRGPPGTSVRLSVARPGEAPRELVVERAEIRGGLPIDVCLIASRRVAYLAIPTLLDRTVPDKVRLVLEALTADEPLAGLVLDNRMNGGGSQGVLAAGPDGGPRWPGHRQLRRGAQRRPPGGRPGRGDRRDERRERGEPDRVRAAGRFEGVDRP